MPTKLIKCNRAVRIRNHVEKLWTWTLIGMLIEMFTLFTPRIQPEFLSYRA